MNCKRWLSTLVTTIVLAATCLAQVNVRDFIGDDAKDCGPGIQAAIDSLVDSGGWPNRSGGELYFEKGFYRVSTPIVVRCPGVIMRGVGSAYTFACTIEWRNKDPDAALFTFVGPDKQRKGPSSAGFHMEDLRIRGPKTGVAFRFAPKGKYARGISFERVTCQYFAKVFEFQNGPQRVWGGLVCRDCTMTYNGQIVDASSGCANQSLFDGCQLHKNGMSSEGWPPRYAMDFLGTDAITCRECILEGMPRAFRARRSQQIRLIGCRFEGNATSQDPVVLIEDTNGVFIQAYHRVLGIEAKPQAPPTVLLRNCRDYDVKPMLGKVHVERGWEARY